MENKTNYEIKGASIDLGIGFGMMFGFILFLGIFILSRIIGALSSTISIFISGIIVMVAGFIFCFKALKTRSRLKKIGAWN